MNKIFKYFFVITTVMFAFYGVVGYLTFRDHHNVEKLTYLSLIQSNSVLLILAYAFALINCLTIYAFNFKPTRDLIENYFLNKY